MKTASQIKQQIVTALENSDIFDTVNTPSDDRISNTLMKEPAASVFFSGFTMAEDSGVKLLSAKFSVIMKFLKIGVNETEDDIQTVMECLKELEPAQLSQKMKQAENGRSALYQADITFVGCR